MLQLFAFVRADLNNFRPASANPFEYNEEVAVSGPTSEPNFPKSLFLIQPLSSSYELNTVAVNAQASVPIPDGLDLNAWIVPPPRGGRGWEGGEQEDEQEGKDQDTEEAGNGERKVRKGKKGKGRAKDTGVPKLKGKKRRDVGTDDTLMPVSVEVEETEVEREERERVSLFCFGFPSHMGDREEGGGFLFRSADAFLTVGEG